MKDYLVIKLQGPMQAWGEHTFEGLRPSGNFPTRSALLGLLGSCLGIRRDDKDHQQHLADSVSFAVRKDRRRVETENGIEKTLSPIKATDYHTIMSARKNYSGLESHETIQTWREYLFDAEYTVAIWSTDKPVLTLDDFEKAIKLPIFTPYLGRRSCPLAQPLFRSRLFAQNLMNAFESIKPVGGIIYCDESPISEKDRTMRLRDVPLIRQPRQFATRTVYVHGGDHVPK